MARKLCTYRMPGYIDGGNNHRFDLAYERSRRLTFRPRGRGGMQMTTRQVEPKLLNSMYFYNFIHVSAKPQQQRPVAVSLEGASKPSTLPYSMWSNLTPSLSLSASLFLSMKPGRLYFRPATLTVNGRHVTFLRRRLDYFHKQLAAKDYDPGLA